MDGDLLNNEKDLLKKYKDIDKKGIQSAYWEDVLDVIKWLEKNEEYEKCQDLWDYYQSQQKKSKLGD